MFKMFVTLLMASYRSRNIQISYGRRSAVLKLFAAYLFDNSTPG
jgi:hypothetical protein